jgi:putative IMPACT (imprinted ancient) family translation regulator
MTCHPEYYIPAETVSTGTEIKKSKFITTITAVTSKEVILPFFKKLEINILALTITVLLIL